VTAAGAEAGNDLAPSGPAEPAPDGAQTAADRVEPIGGSRPTTAPERAGGGDGRATPAKPAMRPGRMLLRGVIAVVLAAASAVGAWLLAARGVRTDVFPPFVAGDQSTTITRYSGPWLTAAAAAALLAALLLLAAVLDIVRWSRARSASAGIG
jgi:hypothetical protein